MKIHNNDLIIKNPFPVAKTPSQPQFEKEFGTILKQHIETSKNADTAAHQVQFVRPLDGVQMGPRPGFDNQVALDRVEELIGLLDQYRHKLANPKVTLKNIDPLVKKIDQETQKLAPLLESLPESEALNNIVNQALVTASLEVTRFYRGDYIAP